MLLTAAMVVSVALGGSGADALAKQSVSGLELRVPSVWKHRVEDGTHHWVAPSKDASFSLDAFPWQGEPISAEACRDKLMAALGGEGWEKTTVGGQPAAKRTYADKLEDGKDVETHSFVGCDGKTKWALTFVMNLKKKDRFGTLAGKIVDSIQYGAQSK